MLQHMGVGGRQRERSVSSGEPSLLNRARAVGTGMLLHCLYSTKSRFPSVTRFSKRGYSYAMNTQIKGGVSLYGRLHVIQSDHLPNTQGLWV